MRFWRYYKCSQILPWTFKISRVLIFFMQICFFYSLRVQAPDMSSSEDFPSFGAPVAAAAKASPWGPKRFWSDLWSTVVSPWPLLPFNFYPLDVDLLLIWPLSLPFWSPTKNKLCCTWVCIIFLQWPLIFLPGPQNCLRFEDKRSFIVLYWV